MRAGRIQFYKLLVIRAWKKLRCTNVSIGQVPTRQFLLFARNPRLPITFALDHIQLPIFTSLRSPCTHLPLFFWLLHEFTISSIYEPRRSGVGRTVHNRICIYRHAPSCAPPTKASVRCVEILIKAADSSRRNETIGN